MQSPYLSILSVRGNSGIFNISKMPNVHNSTPLSSILVKREATGSVIRRHDEETQIFDEGGLIPAEAEAAREGKQVLRTAPL